MEVKGAGPALSAMPAEQRSGRKPNGRAIKQTRNYRLLFWSLGRQLLRLALIFSIAVFLWKVYGYALSSPVFGLERIDFVGARNLDVARLEEKIRGRFPRFLLKIDLHKLQEYIELEPWVERAEVRRILPSSLEIRVREREPRAVAEINSELYLIDGEGLVLAPYQPRFGRFDLPIVKGLLAPEQSGYPEENKRRAKLYFKVITELDSGGSSYSKGISEIDVSNPNNAVLIPMNDTVLIYLGDSDFLKRYRTFLENIASYLELKQRHGQIEAVDLRYENQIVYKI